MTRIPGQEPVITTAASLGVGDDEALPSSLAGEARHLFCVAGIATTTMQYKNKRHPAIVSCQSTGNANHIAVLGPVVNQGLSLPGTTAIPVCGNASGSEPQECPDGCYDEYQPSNVPQLESAPFNRQGTRR